jgi:hypothetical protein
MRMYAATVSRRLIVWEVLSQEIPDSEPRERRPGSVAEYDGIGELDVTS